MMTTEQREAWKHELRTTTRGQACGVWKAADGKVCCLTILLEQNGFALEPGQNFLGKEYNKALNHLLGDVTPARRYAFTDMNDGMRLSFKEIADRVDGVLDNV